MGKVTPEIYLELLEKAVCIKTEWQKIKETKYSSIFLNCAIQHSNTKYGYQAFEMQLV